MNRRLMITRTGSHLKTTSKPVEEWVDWLKAWARLYVEDATDCPSVTLDTGEKYTLSLEPEERRKGERRKLNAAMPCTIIHEGSDRWAVYDGGMFESSATLLVCLDERKAKRDRRVGDETE